MNSWPPSAICPLLLIIVLALLPNSWHLQYFCLVHEFKSACSTFFCLHSTSSLMLFYWYTLILMFSFLLGSFCSELCSNLWYSRVLVLNIPTLGNTLCLNLAVTCEVLLLSNSHSDDRQVWTGGRNRAKSRRNRGMSKLETDFGLARSPKSKSKSTAKSTSEIEVWTTLLNELCNVPQAGLTVRIWAHISFSFNLSNQLQIVPLEATRSPEQRLTNQELIELWCQALILEMELSRKRMAEVEAAFDPMHLR